MNENKQYLQELLDYIAEANGCLRDPMDDLFFNVEDALNVLRNLEDEDRLEELHPYIEKLEGVINDVGDATYNLRQLLNDLANKAEGLM